VDGARCRKSDPKTATPGRADGIVGFEVNFFVFYQTPGAVHEDIVAPAALAIDAYMGMAKREMGCRGFFLIP